MQPFSITSIGPDRPGILQTLSDYLSSKEINIDDLYAVVKDGDFVLICHELGYEHSSYVKLVKEMS